jgi:hypothetical protein
MTLLSRLFFVGFCVLSAGFLLLISPPTPTYPDSRSTPSPTPIRMVTVSIRAWGCVNLWLHGRWRVPVPGVTLGLSHGPYPWIGLGSAVTDDTGCAVVHGTYTMPAGHVETFRLTPSHPHRLYNFSPPEHVFACWAVNPNCESGIPFTAFPRFPHTLYLPIILRN